MTQGGEGSTVVGKILLASPCWKKEGFPSYFPVFKSNFGILFLLMGMNVRACGFLDLLKMAYHRRRVEGRPFPNGYCLYS